MLYTCFCKEIEKDKPYVFFKIMRTHEGLEREEKSYKCYTDNSPIMCPKCKMSVNEYNFLCSTEFRELFEKNSYENNIFLLIKENVVELDKNGIFYIK